MVSRAWNELFDLEGQVALVTGGAMGIGEGIARRLLDQGAFVIIADVNEKVGSQTATNLSRESNKCHFVRADLRGIDQLTNAVTSAVHEFGHLDFLVNNAGVFPFARFLDVSPELWDRVLGTNLRGAFFMSQAAARQMRQQKSGGSILNIASVDALHPTGMLSPYDASKGGLHMLTRSLALELASENIRVNAIAPGGIQTPGAAVATTLPKGGDPAKVAEQFTVRIPLRRMGEPEDIANAALFLLSPAASYVTGVTLVVDGGYLLA